MKNYIFITGASSGVGREIAIHLSRTHPLILNGRDTARLEETKKLCGADSDILLWSYNLAEYQTLEQQFALWIMNHKVQVEGFVHCAGAIKIMPLRGVTPEILEGIFAIHVFAPELILKVLASKKYNAGNLKSAVLISSNISGRGASAFSVYGASKAALDGMVRNLAVELAPKIRVNSILPGGMITEMTKEIFADKTIKKELEENYPLGIGTPNDIAPMVEFLLSEQSRWITGQQITIDGGRTTDITERGKRK